MVSVATSQTLQNALDQLRAERDRLGSAIIELERILGNTSGGRRRGRPPGSGKQPKQPPSASAPKKRKWSPAAREAAAIRMKQYWAARNKEKANG